MAAAPVHTTGTQLAAPTTAAPASTSQAGFVRNANDQMVPGTTPATTPLGGGTTTANISSPTPSGKNITPAVISSNAAQADLTNKQNQVIQLNNDTANHNAVIASAQQQTQQNAAQNPPANPSNTSSSPTTTTPGSLDDQVNDILSGFNSNEATIEKAGTDEANDYAQQAQQAQADLDSQASVALGQLKQIATGAYPLSSAESSILSATAAGYQQAIQFQQQANQAYTGQMTEAMASLGIETSAPTQAMGMINSSISEGTQKVADLNGQMAISLGNLQLAFQKEDFAEVQNSWDETSKYLEDRVTTLQNMQKSVMDATAAQRQAVQDQFTSNLTAYMDTANFDQKTAQDAISNALSYGTLNEKTANDLSTRAETAAHDRATEADAAATLQEKQKTDAMSPSNGASIISASLVPGATWTNPDTGNTEQTLDKNGKVTVDAFKAILAEAPAYQIPGNTILQNYGNLLATDKKGQPLASYGLTPAQMKVVAGVLPAQ